MGQVYLCRDEALSRNVALKVLPKGEGEESEQDIRRFVQEGRLLAQIHHPNISSVYHIGEDDRCAFLVMEYIKGEMLHRLIRDLNLNLQEKVSVLQGVALGLHEAHKRGIVHRDIKPANILITESGQAKLIDFGIAKSMFSKNEVTTETGAVIGTMNYIAPEIFSGSYPSIKSDVYALGLVLFEMVTGLLPFDGPSRLSVLENIRTRNLKYPTDCEPLLPPAFLRLILEATDPDPEKRTVSAKDFHSRLEAIRLNHIPEKFLIPIRELKVSNRQEVLNFLEKSQLPRALWPLAVSKTVYKDPHSENDASQLETVKIENEEFALSLETLDKSIVTVLELCAKQRALDRTSQLKPNAPKPSENHFKSAGRKIGFELVLAVLLTVVGFKMVASYMYERASRINSRTTASVEQHVPEIPPAPVTTAVKPTPVAEVGPITFTSLEKKYPTVGLYTENETNDWPPVPMANLKIGTKVIYRDKRFFDEGKVRMVRELWELVGFDGITLKWKIQEIDKDGKLLFKPWHGWFRNNGQLTADVKGEVSHFLFAFEVSIVGNPDEIFPMRKGRVVVHETYGEMDDNRIPVKMRTISVVRDKEIVSTAIGSVNAVRIDAYFESGLTPEIVYYSPEIQMVVLWRGPRLDRRQYEIVKELEAIVEVGKGQDFQSHLLKLKN